MNFCLEYICLMKPFIYNKLKYIIGMLYNTWGFHTIKYKVNFII